MSTGRTPSTDDVRRTFTYSRAGDRTHRDQEYRDQFDRWLAAHDRAVRAEALREAADEADMVITAGDSAEACAPVPGESGRHRVVNARDELYEDPASWLRARAVEVEKGAGA